MFLKTWAKREVAFLAKNELKVRATQIYKPKLKTNFKGTKEKNQSENLCCVADFWGITKEFFNINQPLYPAYVWNYINKINKVYLSSEFESLPTALLDNGLNIWAQFVRPYEIENSVQWIFSFYSFKSFFETVPRGIFCSRYFVRNK